MGICPLKQKAKIAEGVRRLSLKSQVAPLKQPVKRDINKKYILKFDQVLGMGQFGKVFLATSAFDKTLKVAVKALSKERLGEKIVKLKKEVVFLRKLDSPNVVKYHEFFEDKKYFYLVMEYCPGGELFREIAMKLESRQRYKEKEAALIMQKLFKAVSHIHSKGIAHRDIKPENIIWSREKDDCRFKLIDFGLAHKFAKNKEVQTGMIVGTPLYLAPEAFDGISTMEADIWGCGVLLCVMLSGSYPYVGSNISELRQAIQETAQIGFNANLWTNISDEGKDLVKLLLKIEPKDRIQAQDALMHPWFDKYCPAITLRHNVLKQNPSENQSLALSQVIQVHKSLAINKSGLDPPMLSRAQTLQGSGESTQALFMHPHGSFPKESISPEIIERMWAYSFSDNNPKFRKIALNALVRILPDNETSNLTKQFEIMDTNHTCQLEHDEILEAVASAGLIHITPEQCLKMVDQIDMSGTKTIMYTEFIASTLNLKKVLEAHENEAMLYALFKDFDHQNIEILTVTNLTASLTRMGKEITIQQVEEIIKELKIQTISKDEPAINFNDFKKIILLDPLSALREKGDLHPLFIQEEDEQLEIDNQDL